MEYTPKLFVDFLKKLIVFDKECKSIIDIADRVLRDRADGEKSEWAGTRSRLDSKVQAFSTKKTSLIDGCRRKIDNILEQDMGAKRDVFSRLQKCKEALAVINSVEKSITSRNEYESTAKSQAVSSSMSLDEVLSGTDKFINLAYDVNTAIRDGRKRDMASKAAQLYGMCRRAEEVLNAEISRLRTSIIANKDGLHTNYDSQESDSHRQLTLEWDIALSVLDSMTAEFVAQREKSKAETKTIILSSSEVKHTRIDKLIDGFCKQFPPKDFADEYSRIYSIEPMFDHYECAKEMPRNIFISTLEYDISKLQLSDFTKEFLDKYYYFMYRGEKLLIPHCAQFRAC